MVWKKPLPLHRPNNKRTQDNNIIKVGSDEPQDNNKKNKYNKRIKKEKRYPARVKKERKKEMKKIVLLVVALFSMTLTYAENENNNNVQDVKAYDMTVNIRKLAVALGLTLDQMEIVADIHSNFCNEMMLAAYAEGDDRTNLVDKAVAKDIRFMHYVLNEKQYKKYVMLLNLTLSNRGLK